MRAVGRVVGVVVALVVLYLLLWPTRIAPVAWTPPKAPKLEGAYAVNDRLHGGRVLLTGEVGPEATAFDAQGRLYTGLLDGRIRRVDLASGRVEAFANTGGRPLGLGFDASGALIVADAK